MKVTTLETLYHEDHGATFKHKCGKRIVALSLLSFSLIFLGLLPFCLLHNHHSIPPIVLCPWLTLMYCVKIEKVREHQKYETIAWLVIGVVHNLNTLCGEDGS